MSNADRQRRFRRRRRRGVTVWPIEVPAVELQDALVEAGLVEADAPPEAYRTAAARVLSDFVSRYNVTRYGRWLSRHGKTDA